MAQSLKQAYDYWQDQPGFLLGKPSQAQSRRLAMSVDYTVIDSLTQMHGYKQSYHHRPFPIPIGFM